jgi:hypothetical protein
MIGIGGVKAWLPRCKDCNGSDGLAPFADKCWFCAMEKQMNCVACLVSVDVSSNGKFVAFANGPLCLHCAKWAKEGYEAETEKVTQIVIKNTQDSIDELMAGTCECGAESIKASGHSSWCPKA